MLVAYVSSRYTQSHNIQPDLFASPGASLCTLINVFILFAVLKTSVQPQLPACILLAVFPLPSNYLAYATCCCSS